MIPLITVAKAQEKIAENTRSQRLVMGLTQQGLAGRSGVALPTLRKFEQKGLISLEAFLNSLIPPPKPFISSGIFFPPKSNTTNTTTIAICHGPANKNIFCEIIYCKF